MRVTHVGIVGAGIAGMAAAYALLPHARVTLFEAQGPAAGASGVAAGLANPFMGRKALPVEERTGRLDALFSLLEKASLAEPAAGVLRPATSREQSEVFARRATEYPEALRWLSVSETSQRWPCVTAPYGGLWVREGRAVDVSAFVARLFERAVTLGAEARLGLAGSVARVAEHDALVSIEAQDGAETEVDAVILCTGGAAWHLGGDLPLHRVKGQIVRLHAPAIAQQLPNIAGHGYLVPEGDTIVVGSTFEHHFSHTRPTPEGIALLRAQAAQLVPALATAPVVDAKAGVRVTVPHRRTLLCPVSTGGRVWVFNGLAAKGLLTAPYLARSLWKYLNDPTSVPANLGLAGI